MLLHSMKVIAGVVMTNLQLTHFLPLFPSQKVQNLISQRIWTQIKT